MGARVPDLGRLDGAQVQVVLVDVGIRVGTTRSAGGLLKLGGVDWRVGPVAVTCDGRPYSPREYAAGVLTCLLSGQPWP